MKKEILILLMTLIFIFSGCIQIPITESPESTPRPAKPDFAEKPIILKDNFLAGSFFIPEVIELNVVQRWHHSSSKQLSFKSLNPPYVVNAAIARKTSQIATSLEVWVYQKGDPYKRSDLPITMRNHPVQAFIIVEEGNYIIDVKSVGCEWWVLIGHESEGLRD